MLSFILANKPVLVGLHLGFAIIGIDALLWLLGELIANPANRKRLHWAAGIGAFGLLISWLIGGYYYVTYYGVLVKPEIVAGSAPWAHAIAMEAKEHIFLLVIPVVLTILLAAFLPGKDLQSLKLKTPLIVAIILAVGTSLAIGLMGFIISAAARWA